MYEGLVKSLRYCATHDCIGEGEREAGCTAPHSLRKDFDTCNQVLQAQAADAIEELSREYESIAKSLNESVELVRKLQSSHWIPVTERLPESVDDDVLVSDGESYAVGYWRPDAQAWDSTDFGWLENRSEPPCGIHTVTHWMPLPPLPEPPKEEA